MDPDRRHKVATSVGRAITEIDGRKAAAALVAGGAIAAGAVGRERRAKRHGPRAGSGLALDPDEYPAAGIRRIGRGQIDLALGQLQNSPAQDLDEGIHEARKAFKRQRAVLRLVRGVLGPEAYRRENEVFRDAGRELSDMRDRQVMVETLDVLMSRYANRIPPGAFAGLRAALVGEYEAARERVHDGGQAIGPVLVKVRAARRRVAGWPLPPDGDSAFLAPGFERIYRRGRLAWRAAKKDPNTETLHELRKRAKDLWHAAEVLTPHRPKRMGKVARRAHRLADAVGDDHDLAVLVEAARERSATLSPDELRLLEGLIERRRARLQSKGLSRARSLYAPPRAPWPAR
jgi:CHAD domain-containing protein